LHHTLDFPGDVRFCVTGSVISDQLTRTKLFFSGPATSLHATRQVAEIKPIGTAGPTTPDFSLTLAFAACMGKDDRELLSFSPGHWCSRSHPHTVSRMNEGAISTTNVGNPSPDRKSEVKYGTVAATTTNQGSLRGRTWAR